MDYAAFKALGLALAEVEESTSYGTPALKVHGCMRHGERNYTA